MNHIHGKLQTVLEPYNLDLQCLQKKMNPYYLKSLLRLQVTLLRVSRSSSTGKTTYPCLLNPLFKHTIRQNKVCHQRHNKYVKVIEDGFFIPTVKGQVLSIHLEEEIQLSFQSYFNFKLLN